MGIALSEKRFATGEIELAQCLPKNGWAMPPDAWVVRIVTSRYPVKSMYAFLETELGIRQTGDQRKQKATKLLTLLRQLDACGGNHVDEQVFDDIAKSKIIGRIDIWRSNRNWPELEDLAQRLLLAVGISPINPQEGTG